MSDSMEAANYEIVKVLKDNEDKVITLTKSKPFNLVDEMFQKHIITGSMNDQLLTLDHSRVDPQLQLRYLLRLVTQRTKEDGSVGDKFINLLECRGEQSLCKYLRRRRAGVKEPEAKRMHLDGSLDTDDLKWILEVLHQVSPDWVMLGTALPIPYHCVENCREDTNVKSLRKLLIEWLSGGSATVSTLTLALRSELVGKPRVALEVEEKFTSHNTSTSAPCSTQANTSSLVFTIVNQSSHNTEVEDGKSTLLLVQVSHRENVSYQWNKNGQPLADGCSYSGVHNDLLVIKNAHQGTGGEYTCCVRSQEREVVSHKMTLTVLYPPEKKTLLNRYSINPHIEDWPPVGTKTFINLALTSQSVDLVYGDPDDTLKNLQKIEYKKVFTYKTCALILVEGRPGSGKTTLIHKLIKDWKQGKILVEAGLVFLVSLRTLSKKASDKTTLTSLLKIFYSNQKDLIAFISKIEKSNGEGVCFVFDGLDEYHPQEEDNSVVFQLLYKTYLPEAMIIVTSRPGAMARLREEAVTLEIEVFGFTKEQISEFIDNFPFGFSSDGAYGSKDLKKYLELHSNIFYMCYLPIHAAIICFVYKIERGHLPDTQTKIYNEFTRSMILRHLKRQKKETKLKSLKDIPGFYEECFKKLCHLAFSMTLNDQQIIDEDSLKNFPLYEASGNPEDWSLGLVSCNRTAQLCGICTSYTFLHLTLQEFLAAYHLVNKEGKEKCELVQKLQQTCPIFGFSNIWTYYFGLETFEAETELSILNNAFSSEAETELSILNNAFSSEAETELSILSNAFSSELYATETTKNYFLTKISVKLAHESQQQIVCDEVVRRIDGIVNQHYIHPSDVPALAYVISTTSKSITELNLSFKNKYDVEYVLEQIQRTNFRRLQVFILDTVINNLCAIQCLTNILQSCINIKELGLYRCDLPEEQGKKLANQLRHLTDITHLILRHISGKNVNPFHFTRGTYRGHTFNHNPLHRLLEHLFQRKHNTGLLEVINQIHRFPQLINLNISYWKFNLNWCEDLASNICGLTKLEYLNLSCNDICSDGITSLANALHNLPKLKILDLSGNNIRSEGITSLTFGLHNLSILDLSANSIGSDGIKNLAFELLHLTELTVLNLGSNNIGSDGANCLASKLHHLTKLTVLDLNNNKIGSDGANSLASELHHLTQLHFLFLAVNGITTHSAINIITSLKDCKKLSYVTFSKKFCELSQKPGFQVGGVPECIKDHEELIAAIKQHKTDADLHLKYRTFHVEHNPESTQNHSRQKSRLCDCSFAQDSSPEQ